MGIELPVLEYVPSWVLGGEWPDGDEDQVWQMAEAWHCAGQGVTQTVEAATGHVNQLLSCYQGPGADALRCFWEEKIECLRELACACDELSQFCDGSAMQIQYTKLAIIANLLILVATIISLIAAAVATFGSSTAGIPIAQQATSITCKELIKQLLIAIGKGALQGLLMSAGVDLAIQGLQVGMGTRDSIDFAQTGKAALSGAISGAIGGAAGFAAGRMNLTGPGNVAAGNFAAGAAGGVAGGFVSTLATGGSLEEAIAAGRDGALSGGLGGAAGGLEDAHNASVISDRTDGPIPVAAGTPIENMPNSGNRGTISPEGTITAPANPNYRPPVDLPMVDIAEWLSSTSLGADPYEFDDN